MANIVYEWNPFQQRVDNRITKEVIKTSTVTDRVEFVPRGAPFFSRNFQLYRQGSLDPLVLGYDYCFAHQFGKFIGKYDRNVFGSVIMLRPVASDVLLASYDTIGAGFVLDQVAFAELVANIVNAPRIADWEELDVPTIPTEFPPDPHDHPATQTYDYEEMMTALKSLVLSVTDSVQNVTIKELLEEHLSASLIEAHAATAADLGLPLTPNMKVGVTSDLAGNSGNLLVTINLMKTALRQLADGTLNLGPGGDAPHPPTELNISSSVQGSSTVYTITIRGGVAADGTAVTYTLTQSGGATVVFSKSAGIAENEQVTFTAPTVQSNTLVTISATAVDSIGAVSAPISASVTLVKDGGGSTPGIGSGTITYIDTDAVLTAAQAGIIVIDASVASRAVVLPPSNEELGITDFIVRRKDNTSNTLTVAGSGTDKIKFHTHLRPEGYGFLILVGAGDYWHLRSDKNGGWIPVSRYDNAPLGHPVMESTISFNPGGWGPMNGTVLTRLALPWLWDHAQQSGMFTTEANRVGNEGGWTQGNGTTTFRGPEVRGRFPRFLSEGAPIDLGRPGGSTQAGQLEFHAHNIPGAGGFGTQMMGGGYNNYALWVPGVTSGFGGNETRPTNVAYPGRIKMI